MTPLTPEDMFSPAILKWARREMGFTVPVVHGKLSPNLASVTPDLIEAWEAGSAYPTPSHILQLATIYKRPVAVFLLSHPPGNISLPPDRRTLHSHPGEPFSPEALLAIRRARRVQGLTRLLDTELGTSHAFAYPRHHVTEDPEALAARVREDIDISRDVQRRAGSYKDFFEYIRSRLEATGVITLRTTRHLGFPTSDARALSLADREPYIVLINNKDFEGAKNFSLLHEFAHILLRDAGVCDSFATFDNSTRADPVEIFCNRFAAAVLVPAKDLREHPLVAKLPRVHSADFEKRANDLARQFKVSRFVILRRLLTVGLISLRDYKEKASEWENERPAPRTGGRAVPSKVAIASNGISFSRLVYDAYRRDKVSTATAANFLNLKARHFGAFEKEIQRYGG